MNRSPEKINGLDIGFYAGLAIKAINALIEFVGGLMMIVLNHDWLNRLIRLVAIPELREDPNDFIMNYLVRLGQNLSINSQHSVAIYMLLHGITKLIVIWFLWKKKTWAYLPAVAVFGLFIAYEIYSYVHTQSPIMVPIIIIDVAIIVLIILEYIRLKAGKEKK
ncbi:DUF2127 domain-containing protein [Parasporobacterium paucivorans]|uniref:Uncharacterized membrane protein n=1 Tax=Parasporobacterium paucivorans DSM 15970 TaxID=1122934 RepID=A0A1M6D2J5_9FIRM|nr:DUF2127 domain-containing protein [Parasporobacterium paucivorans]SHI67460.1 Uncharacterized membrane protein [Parasporobacterium paucivorans DSM 15970]